MTGSMELPRWLQRDEAREGRIVWLDGGFTCHAPGPVTLRLSKDGELYFDCHDGRHYLSGQEDDDHDFYVGVFVSDPGPLTWQNKMDQGA